MPTCNRPRRPLKVERLGQVPYLPMLALQQERHEKVANGQCDDTLFLLEHEPVVTLGKNTQEGHVLVSKDSLLAQGVALVQTGRGGDVTFHGPGQIVGYPIVALQAPEQDIKKYVWCLEEILIRTVGDYGIAAQRLEGLRGIWVGQEKIGAIGVRLAKWTTMHGFALNVSVDLDYFRLIVPCGLRGHGVTSLQRLLGSQTPQLTEVQERLMAHSADILQRQMSLAPPAPVSSLQTMGVYSE